jgi:hypothetical protein
MSYRDAAYVKLRRFLAPALLLPRRPNLEAVVMFSMRSCFLGLILAAAASAAAPAKAGAIALAWDPAPGATGYYVYYGTQSGHYNPVPVTTSATSATIGGLQDCTTYYLAVKAFNAAGSSVEYLERAFGLVSTRDYRGDPHRVRCKATRSSWTSRSKLSVRGRGRSRESAREPDVGQGAVLQPDPIDRHR